MSPQAWLSLMGGMSTLVFVLLWRKERNAAFAYRASYEPVRIALEESEDARLADRARYENAITKAKERSGECAADMEKAFRAGMDSPEAARAALTAHIDSVFSMPEETNDRND